ncbi:MAG: hypothetical protein WAM85_19610 [Terracidiphilus sp.]
MNKLIYGLMLLLTLPASAQRVVRRSFFGMHVKSPVLISKMPIQFGTIGPMPGSAWKWLEPQQDQWNWGSLDAWVKAANRQGYDIIYTFVRTPAWAAPAQNLPPSDLNSRAPCSPPAQGSGDCMFKGFVYTLASRYKGKIKYYQLWNEPNSNGFWNGSIADLVHMTQDAYTIIHEVDPDAQVLTPAPGSGGYPTMHDRWMAEYLRAGGAQWADIGAWHGYLQATTFAAPWPEQANSSTPGCTVGTWRCPGSVLDTYKQMRAVMDANGMAGKQLWDTEGGWGVNDARHSDLPDPEDQSAWLARWFIVQAAAGVDRAVWYLFDATDGWGTLWDQSTGLHPAGVAYQQVYNWLIDTTIMPCTRRKNIWTCELTRPGGYRARIVWSENGGTAYSVPSQFTTVRDLTGGMNPVNGGAVHIGKAPLLLENKPAS